MILDSSVVVEVGLGESGAESLQTALATADTMKMSSCPFLEPAIVVDARRPGALDRFTTMMELRVIQFDQEQAEIARSAYRMFGKGSGHPAQLNFGDCVSYALVKVTGEVMLFKGQDFSQTDIKTLQA